jgi:hypothetical protein
MKRLISITAMAVTMIAFIGTTNLQAQQWSQDEKAVWTEVENMWNNWKAGDLDAAFANVSHDYLGWNNMSPMPISYSKWVSSEKENAKRLSEKKFDIEPARILVHGNVAVVHYYYSYSFLYNEGDKKTRISSKGKWSEFYVKDNGKWMLIGDFTYEVPKKKSKN